MSSNLNYKQTTNVERRKWDREAYEAKAKARAQAEKSGGVVGKKGHHAGEKRSLEPAREGEEPLKEEFTPAAPGAAGPERSKRAYLKARSGKVDIDSKIGSTELVSPEAAATTSTIANGNISIKDGVTKTGVGWYCKVCDCFLKDSHTYLDHINGRKHQRNLGYSMRIERSSKEQVQARLNRLLKKQEEKDVAAPVDAKPTFEDVVQAKADEEERRKEERAKKRAERKKRSQKEEEDIQPEEVNPELAAMLGFSGFGGGNKNR